MSGSRERDLLLRLLDLLRAAGPAPLQAGIDAAALVRAALGADAERPGDVRAVTALTAQALGGPASSAAPSLADWLARLYPAFRAVDPHAFEILVRRIDGWSDREIAVDLDLGLRLAGRIARDLASALRTAC